MSLFSKNSKRWRRFERRSASKKKMVAANLFASMNRRRKYPASSNRWNNW